MSAETLKILDTTLRDGSYVINFQFSTQDTRLIADELDQAGIPLIEVGHGVGLGASRAGQGVAAESDVAYMEAAADAVTRNKWGMFCIPGIAELSDLDAAIDHGAGFLRIGVSVENTENLEPFIARARKAGVWVAANFMKAYTASPRDFAEACRKAASYGAQIVYIVDSAGNMTADDVRAYINAIREVTDVEIGFHGHNNLGLANANAWAAVRAGCSVIDSSLQGMGRCTGNTITEQFIAILERQGMAHDLDLFRLMDTSDMLVRPLLSQIGHDSVDLVCGLAGFHSSFMDVIRDACMTHDVDPRRLILDVCAENQLEAPRDLVEAKAKAIAAEDASSGYRHRFPLRKYFGHEQHDL